MQSAALRRRETALQTTIEINTVTQGGTGDLQVLVDYIPGGGAHATKTLIQWMVVGVDADFTRSAPLTDTGNAISPFTTGQVVKVMTEATNSSGTRNSAPRPITLEAPIVLQGAGVSRLRGGGCSSPERHPPRDSPSSRS